ncbi:Adenylate/guanylate cyclase domain-containing protein [Gammaproteobacteria bacterium]
MAAQVHSLAIMFADISGSTALYESLGDVVARRIVAGCLATLTEITLRNQGTVVKSIGDELLCIFPSARAAVEASAAMHEALDPDLTHNNKDPLSQPQLGVRIGINYGPTLMEDGDIFGDAVNLAARVVSLTKVHQTLCTGQTIESLGGQSSFDTRCLGRTTVKGKLEEIDIYEVIWKQEDLTSVMVSSLPSPSVRVRLLHLELGEKKLEIGQQRQCVTLGRGQNSDLVTAEPLASRTHARIESRHGKFIIQDQSTNGTFVRTEDGREVVLHREELLLQGSGLIGLGRVPGPDNPHTLRFQSDD